MHLPPKIGLLVGRERSFPDALIAEVARRNCGVTAEYARVDIVHAGRAPDYAVLIDRISHDVPCYQAWLKHAALMGAHVINNPFWRISDDKMFDTALAASLGVAVPKTALLPSKGYGADITTESLRNLGYPLSWDRLERDLGYPMYLKPHWGGGWRDVYKVNNREELFQMYDRTGTLAMIAQQAIEWTVYVRCIVIGREHVLPAPWDPRLGHYERYLGAAKTMPPLSEELRTRIVSDAQKICRALEYDMNTVEFAVQDGVPYAIDMMNSAPDFDISSLGEEQFRWTVERMADLTIGLAKQPARPRHGASDALGGSHHGRVVTDGGEPTPLS